MNEWVWSNGGMILTEENWSAGRKTLYSVGGRWMNEYGAMVKWYWQGKIEVLGGKHYTAWVRWMNEDWAMVEWYWQGKTEILGEKHYTAWVVDEWMSVEQWWNDSDRGNWSAERKNLSQLYLSMKNPMWYGLGLNPINTTKRWQLHEKWHGLFQALMWMIRLLLLDIYCNCMS